MDRMGHHQIQTTQKYPMHCPRPIGRTSTHSSGYHEERTGDSTTNLASKAANADK
jgi:hypothetical protein